LQAPAHIVDALMNNANALPEWLLHPQLDQDSVAVADLPLSRLLLSRDANYPWLLLVPRRAGASEIIDLGTAEQVQLMTEIDMVSRALRAVTACDKLNVAAIGNVVPQLHIHIVARWRDDPAWPKPVWGTVPARAYDPAERECFIAALRRKIELS
jgi:diadenosine tetraphosphate (Ap4A) HIT family hydrolase